MVEEFDWAPVFVRHLLLCREVSYDASTPDSAYTLHGLLTTIRPNEAFPLVWKEPIYIYVQWYGAPGDYEIWIELVRVVTDEIGDAIDDSEATTFGPYAFQSIQSKFVQSRVYVLRRLPLRESGLYEIRLFVAGYSDPLVSERLFVEEL